jgi:hypothetical protein
LFDGADFGTIRINSEFIDRINPKAITSDFRSTELRLMEMFAAKTPEEMNPRLYDGRFKAPRVAPTKPVTFKFDELSEGAKATTRKWYIRKYGVNTDGIQDMFEQELKALGYPVENIKYKLTGDDRGVAFYGYVKDWKLTKIARRLLTPRKAWYIRQFMVAHANIEVYIGGRYRRDHQPDNMELGRDWSVYNAKSNMENFRQLVNELRNKMEQETKYVSKMLTKKADKMYAELVSSDKMDEAIRALDFNYHESGHHELANSIRLKEASAYALFA